MTVDPKLTRKISRMKQRVPSQRLKFRLAICWVAGLLLSAFAITSLIANAISADGTGTTKLVITGLITGIFGISGVIAAGMVSWAFISRRPIPSQELVNELLKYSRQHNAQAKTLYQLPEYKKTYGQIMTGRGFQQVLERNRRVWYELGAYTLRLKSKMKLNDIELRTIKHHIKTLKQMGEKIGLRPEDYLESATAARPVISMVK